MIPRNQPVLEVVDDFVSSPVATADLATRIEEMLRAYPHFVVLTGNSWGEDRKPIEQLMRAIANTSLVKAGQTHQGEKIEFTRVEINAKKVAQSGGQGSGTRYSRTNQPLALHTDRPHMANPYELVVMQYVRVDEHGGDTLMAPVEEVISALDPDAKETLAQPKFPFGRGARPVLWEKNGKPNIRYYRTNLDKARQTEDSLTERDLAALEMLDAVLLRDDILFKFHARAGQTVFLQNTKTLHGRTGFSADSDRLMYRMRMHAGCLI
jgi:alpha-ketoglutarate-dependent taurine dioxygenase